MFARMVQAEGIKHIFGFPGGATVDLAEEARRTNVEFIAAHSEWSASYMAAMYGDLTRRPGIALATLGPGATNLVNGLAHAYLDRSPVVAVTGRGGTKDGAHAHQRLNQVSIFEPVTKWSTTVFADSFAYQFHRAIRVAMAERPGSVHLDLPADVASTVCPDVQLSPASELTAQYGPASMLERAAERVAAARRPILLVGIGALRRDAGPALRRCVEAWGIPVVTTAKAKGVLPEDHPYWAGVVDMAGPHLTKDFLRQADLFVAAGFDAVELIGHWEFSTPTIHVDALPNTDEVYISDLDLVGEIGATLDILADLARGGQKWAESDVAGHRAECRRQLTPAVAGLPPSRVVQAAREVLSDDALVISDVGSHKMLLGQLWPTLRPRTFFMSNGLGTMGFGLPAAVAAKLVRRDAPVVCFTGDGGFAMVVAELGTAVDLKLPVVVVIFNDGSLDRIVQKQAALGYPLVGTRFGNPDFGRLAEAYGAAGFRACSADEVQRYLAASLQLDGPAVIDVHIDAEEYRAQFET